MGRNAGPFEEVLILERLLFFTDSQFSDGPASGLDGSGEGQGKERLNG